MKVKATKYYFDKVLNKNIEADTELEVDEARATVLVNAGVAVVISEAAKEQPPKNPRKKKEPKNEQ